MRVEPQEGPQPSMGFRIPDSKALEGRPRDQRRNLEAPVVGAGQSPACRCRRLPGRGEGRWGGESPEHLRIGHGRGFGAPPTLWAAGGARRAVGWGIPLEISFTAVSVSNCVLCLDPTTGRGRARTRPGPAGLRVRTHRRAGAGLSPPRASLGSGRAPPSDLAVASLLLVPPQPGLRVDALCRPLHGPRRGPPLTHPGKKGIQMKCLSACPHPPINHPLATPSPPPRP